MSEKTVEHRHRVRTYQLLRGENAGWYTHFVIIGPMDAEDPNDPRNVTFHAPIAFQTEEGSTQAAERAVVDMVKQFKVRLKDNVSGRTILTPPEVS